MDAPQQSKSQLKKRLELLIAAQHRRPADSRPAALHVSGWRLFVGSIAMNQFAMIREATLDDLDVLARIIRESFRGVAIRFSIK